MVKLATREIAAAAHIVFAELVKVFYRHIIFGIILPHVRTRLTVVLLWRMFMSFYDRL